MCGKKVIQLAEMLVGTIAATLEVYEQVVLNKLPQADEGSYVELDLTGVQYFIQHVGRDIRIDITSSWWVAHIISGLIVKCAKQETPLKACRKAIEELLRDTV